MDKDFLLIRQMKSGDETAMDKFVRKYYPLIFRYCQYHISDRAYGSLSFGLTQTTNNDIIITVINITKGADSNEVEYYHVCQSFLNECISWLFSRWHANMV